MPMLLLIWRDFPGHCMGGNDLGFVKGWSGKDFFSAKKPTPCEDM